MNPNKSSNRMLYTRFYSILLTYLLLFLPPICQAQNGNIWTFGYHNGIDFNTSPLSIMKSSPQIENPNSCASYCDSMGNLQIYTDGKNLYSKNHTLIQNTKDLKGESVMNQSVLILPSKNYDEYIIITSNDADKRTKGLYYTTVNTNSEKVIIKNKLLAKGTFLNLTTIKHINNKDYWIIAKKFPDTFYIFRLAGDIISKPEKEYFSKPVVNEPHNTYFSHLNPSFDGRLIVECCFYESQKRNNSDYATYVVFYDFNSSTGKLSGKRIVLQSFQKEKGYPLQMYNQSAFSTNDSLIYISNIAIHPRTAPLVQLNRYNLEKTEIYSNNKIDPLTAIKTGPDGKIYLTYMRQPYLAVITNPNNQGVYCNLRDNYIKISEENFNRFAFPNVYFKPIGVNFTFKNNCDSTITLINASDTTVFIKFTWFLSNGETFTGNNCRYKFGKSGWHTIKLRAQTANGYSQWYSNSILLSNRPKAEFSIDSTIACQWNEVKFNDLSSTEISNNSTSNNWQWFFGDGTNSILQNPVHIYSQNGKFTVSLVYNNGYCFDTVVKNNLIEVLEAAKPGFQLSHYSFCSPYNLKIFDETRGQVRNVHYDFGDGNNSINASPTHFYAEPGNYNIRQLVYSPNGCITSAGSTLHLRKGFSQKEPVEALNATVINNNQILINWEKHPDAYQYKLFRSENENSFNAVKTTNDQSFIDKMCLTSANIYQYKLIGYDSCQREGIIGNTVNTINLQAQSNGNDFSVLKWNSTESWQNGVKEYVLEYKNENGEFQSLFQTNNNEFKDQDYFQNNNLLEKCYRVRAIENGGNNQQSVSNEVCLAFETFIFVPNAFSPNGDGVNDSFTVIGMCINEVNMNIFNYWGETIFSSSENQNAWDGKYQGQKVDPGPYVYIIRATTAKNESLYYEGVVNLIK